MNPETRLAEIVTALEGASIRCLVMGGHAIRYYGLSRNTIDFDMHLAPDGWEDLPARLARTSLCAGERPVEGPSWRPRSFRRFQIGRLPDGREEWLDCWRENHLLPPFAEAYARKEQGLYGGRVLSFLSLPDVIRSKETERTVDWLDIAVLEEFLDARVLRSAEEGRTAVPDALSRIRSRRGFEDALQRGFLADDSNVDLALAGASLSITQAFLLPLTRSVVSLPLTVPAIEPVILSRLRTVSPASPLHFTLVEAVRRQYRLAAQAADRADKEMARKGFGE